MDYRIDYGPPILPPRVPGMNWKKIRLMTAGMLAALIVGVHAFWPEGEQELRQILLPEYAGKTQGAFQKLLDSVHLGAPFGTAIEGFCRDLIAFDPG